MNRVQALYDTTAQLDTLVSQPVTSENREEIIQSLTALLDVRTIQMEELKPPFTTEENILGKELLPMNDRISKQVQQIFDQLKVDIRTIKKQKQSGKKYINPYASMQTLDGRFLDKRK
ncbi:flagellar protein FliT [Terribacillus saccharophilus]|uniref:flagellar protein FliT n=1 Tax=Terribacillus saccharophilus TaxID=361277 RepID=UPI002DC2EC02|nr:flagellar protein FliT [Terribacillus saccharophilus]MEC0289041.1 flagellar protein FliT [Terribacillus saccharophilus]